MSLILKPNARALSVVGAIYVALMAVLLTTMNCGCYTVGSSCFETCGHGCELAMGMFRYGALVDVARPGLAYTEWPVGFGFLVYLSYLLTDATSALPVLVLQAFMLLAMGLIAAVITDGLRPGWGWLGMALVVFNPSAIGLALTLKTDLVFAFVLSWALLFLFRYASTFDWRWAAAAGLFIGLATNVRPTSQFLILLLPVICLLIAAAAPRRSDFVKALLHGVVGLALGAAVVLPWAMHMRSQGEGGKLYSSFEELSVVTSHVNILNAQRDGLPLGDHRVESFDLASEELVRPLHPDWAELSNLQKRQRRVDYAFDLLTSFDAKTYLGAALYSWAGFLFSGGEGYLMSALSIADAEDGLDEAEARRVFALKILTRGFTIITRLLGLFGLWWLFRARQYKTLILIIGSISYFLVIHGFIGWSRFRIGVEIPMLVLATLGFALLRDKFSGPADEPPTTS